MVEFGGLQVLIVPTWVQGWAWRRLTGRVPLKAKGRKMSSRAWKRAHPIGIRWRLGPVEPDHVLRADGKIICTAAQAAALRERAAR